ncbi:fasciclin domain-containing protein [bacterium]|nr:fasciclin domain-containing protein [bacterium]|tara:strand:+ start:57218 stop:57526 length:309 start_codon:yes stop_codon:yes gene_type:complete
MTLEGTKIAIDSKTTPGEVEVGAPAQGTQGLAGRVDGGFVKQMDIEADNGVIHVIDGVASPKVPLIGQNGGYVAGTEPGSGEGRTGLDTKVSSAGGGSGGGW